MKRKSEQIVDRAEADYNALENLTHEARMEELASYLHPITLTRLVKRLEEKKASEKPQRHVLKRAVSV